MEKMGVTKKPSYAEGGEIKTNLSKLKKGDKFYFPLDKDDDEIGRTNPLDAIYVFNNKIKSTYHYSSKGSKFSTSTNRDIVTLPKMDKDEFGEMDKDEFRKRNDEAYKKFVEFYVSKGYDEDYFDEYPSDHKDCLFEILKRDFKTQYPQYSYFIATEYAKGGSMTSGLSMSHYTIYVPLMMKSYIYESTGRRNENESEKEHQLDALKQVQFKYSNYGFDRDFIKEVVEYYKANKGSDKHYDNIARDFLKSGAIDNYSKGGSMASGGEVVKNKDNSYNWFFNWKRGGYNTVWAKTKAQAIKQAIIDGYPSYMPDNQYARERSLQDVQDKFGKAASAHIIKDVSTNGIWSNKDQKSYYPKLKLTDVGFSDGLVPDESTFRKETYKSSRETTEMGNRMTMARGGETHTMPDGSTMLNSEHYAKGGEVDYPIELSGHHTFVEANDVDKARYYAEGISKRYGDNIDIFINQRVNGKVGVDGYFDMLRNIEVWSNGEVIHKQEYAKGGDINLNDRGSLMDYVLKNNPKYSDYNDFNNADDEQMLEIYYDTLKKVKTINHGELVGVLEKKGYDFGSDKDDFRASYLKEGYYYDKGGKFVLDKSKSIEERRKITNENRNYAKGGKTYAEGGGIKDWFTEDLEFLNW